MITSKAMKIFRYVLAAVAAMLADACGQEEPEKTTEEKGFKIEINDLTVSFNNLIHSVLLSKVFLLICDSNILYHNI